MNHQCIKYCQNKSLTKTAVILCVRLYPTTLNFITTDITSKKHQSVLPPPPTQIFCCWLESQTLPCQRICDSVSWPSVFHTSFVESCLACRHGLDLENTIFIYFFYCFSVFLPCHTDTGSFNCQINCRWWWLFPRLRGLLRECLTIHSLPVLFFS